MGRKGIEVVVSELEREQLLLISRSRSMPHSRARRAKIVLMAADGYTNYQIAAQCEVTSPAITHWKRRFFAQGLAGLHDEASAGRPRTHDDDTVAELLAKVLHEKPDGATHWSVRSAAAQTGISKSSVARYLSLFAVQPRPFHLSRRPILRDHLSVANTFARVAFRSEESHRHGNPQNLLFSDRSAVFLGAYNYWATLEYSSIG